MRTYFYGVLFLLAAALPSCKSFVEVPPPVSQLNVNSVFSDDKTATAAVVGIYNDMEFAAPVSTYLTLLQGLSADELASTSDDISFQQFAENTYTPANPYAAAMWGIYFDIYQANACIEGIRNSPALTTATKDQLLGEARFTRAFCYFYLLNLFGDVPLVISTDYRINDTLRRTPVAQVYSQIITDLQDAQNLLKTDYPSDQRVRPNLWTATSLLARVYLYLSKWSDAESQASSVINSGSYSLEDLNSVFLNSSNETIWQLMPVNPFFNTQEAAYFIPGSPTQIPVYPLLDSLVAAFEPGDNRLAAWTGNNIVGSQVYYYPYKYKNASGSPATEYHVVFRLAEQYLIRAEARMRQGNLNGAVSDINVIRARAGLNALGSSLTADQVAAAIRQERRIELFAELGHRWLDLKRTGNTDAVMSGVKPSTWRSDDALWPVPQAQRNANQSLTQNEGY
jgi:hypothetical protein